MTQRESAECLLRSGRTSSKSHDGVIYVLIASKLTICMPIPMPIWCIAVPFISIILSFISIAFEWSILFSFQRKLAKDTGVRFACALPATRQTLTPTTALLTVATTWALRHGRGIRDNVMLSHRRFIPRLYNSYSVSYWNHEDWKEVQSRSGIEERSELALNGRLFSRWLDSHRHDRLGTWSWRMRSTDNPAATNPTWGTRSQPNRALDTLFAFTSIMLFIIQRFAALYLSCWLLATPILGANL